MKNLKLVFAVLVIMLASCKKQASNQLASVEMNFEQLSKAVGSSDIAFLLFDRAGKTEASPTARGRKVKDNATLTTFTDLGLTESGGVLTTTISPDAEWGGVQRFVDITTNDGAVSVCNWNWSYVPAPATKDCNSNGTGIYRGWTSDHNYDVHLSNVLPL